MQAAVIFPNPMLQPFIRQYRVLDSREGVVNRILPDTSLVLAFRYKGAITFTENDVVNQASANSITGIRKSPRLIRYAKDSAAVLVTFKEGGAAAFFKEPLHELSGANFPLNNFVSRDFISRVEDGLAEAKDNAERVLIIERFLLSLLKNQRTDDLVLAAIDKIRQANGVIRIKSLAEDISISQDAFEKRFRKTAGTSPKQFASTVRMRTLIRKGVNINTFTAMAYDAGYFDQSHFNKEFKQFTGQTPSDFFKDPVFW